MSTSARLKKQNNAGETILIYHIGCIIPTICDIMSTREVYAYEYRYKARIAEKRGRVVVFKNNRPKLLVIDLDTEPQIEMSDDEKLEFVASRILREHRAAFEELAK